jgi:hypothetical protein
MPAALNFRLKFTKVSVKLFIPLVAGSRSRKINFALIIDCKMFTYKTDTD